MIVIVEFKKYVAIAYILGVVVGKFSCWEKPSPIILLIVDKISEVGLHHSILPLRLAVNLRVEGNREPFLDFQKVLK